MKTQQTPTPIKEVIHLFGLALLLFNWRSQLVGVVSVVWWVPSWARARRACRKHK